MRPLLVIPAVGLVAMAIVAGCGIADLIDTGTSSSTSSTTTTDASTEASTTSTTTPTGADCAIDSQSGQLLCRAVSTCPTVVIDSEAYPHCGFRIRGAAVDLVCGCGELICSMGAYTTCAQAQQLVTAQTEQGVCVQVAEDRCTHPPASTTSTSSSSTSSSGSTCDHACLSECGGGAACASVCGC